MPLLRHITFLRVEDLVEMLLRTLLLRRLYISGF